MNDLQVRRWAGAFGAAGVLPKWTGWIAFASAAISLAAAPSIYGGTDYTAFYSASGWITYIAQLTFVIWFLIASVSMLVVKREVARPVRQG